MVYTRTTWDTTTTPLNPTNLNNIETGLTAAHAVGAVALDDLSVPGNTSSSTDDQKLTNCMSYAGQQSYPPFITLANRVHNFSVARTPYNGFRLRGPGSPSNAEKSSGAGAYNTALVQLAAGITWMTFTNTGNSQCWEQYFGGFAIRGQSTTQVFATTAGVVLWCSQFDNLSIANVQSSFGSQAAAFVVTNLHFTGVWDIGNNYNGAFHLAGSDNDLWVDGSCLLDSGTGFAPAGGGQYHLWLDFLNNSDIGNLYITCEGQWSGLRIDGPAFNATNQAGHLNFWGVRIEGRNANAPCNGALVRGNGGAVNFFGAHLAHGMANPALMTTHSPVDGGIVHLTAGQYNFHGTEYDRSTGQADQSPYLFYNNGAKLRVSDVLLNATGGTWSGLPAAHTVAGTTVIDYGGSSPTVAAV